MLKGEPARFIFWLSKVVGGRSLDHLEDCIRICRVMLQMAIIIVKNEVIVLELPWNYLYCDKTSYYWLSMTSTIMFSFQKILKVVFGQTPFLWSVVDIMTTFQRAFRSILRKQLRELKTTINILNNNERFFFKYLDKTLFSILFQRSLLIH